MKKQLEMFEKPRLDAAGIKAIVRREAPTFAVAYYVDLDTRRVTGMFWCPPKKEKKS